MKPLFPIVVAILVIATNAHSESTAAKQLAKSKEPVAEAEESEPQTRTERCTVCSGTSSLKTHSHHASAAFQTLPQVSEIHTQQFFEECNSEKGCAGIKLKDGKLVQKYGDLDAFKAAAAANNGEEFEFQAAATKVLEGKIPNSGPFWWMNENSPFKNLGGSGGGSQKFSKFQSSSFSTSSNGGSGGVDIAANPFLNGDFTKINNGFTSGSANFAGQGFQAAGGSQGAGFSGSFGAGLANGFGGGSQSSYKSSSQSTYTTGQNGFAGQGGLNQAGLGVAQGGLAGSQNNFNAFNSASKFASGFTGSSPAPFSSTGANVNLIQNSQKTSEYDFEQQQQTQQNIDAAFASTGNVQGLENSGGELQQTCAGQGYICVQKAQCNNGVVNSNGGNLLRANTQKQYCNIRTEVCCRLETSSLSGIGISQGTLGVGSTFSSTTNQQTGIFAQGGSKQNSFGTSNNGFSVNKGSASSGYGTNTNQFSISGTSGTSQVGSSYGGNKFAGSTIGSGYGTTVAPNPTRFAGNNFNNEVYKTNSQSNFVETDSFTAGSENSGIFRPNVGLKPGVPYLPPVDSSTSASNIFSTSFVTSPRPFTTPRPVTTQRPYTPRVTPTYLPPVSSTSAPGYLPPTDPLDGSESRPTYVDGGIIRDTFLPPTPGPIVPVNNEIPAGCAAALKCTPIEYCTAEGVISNTTVILTRDQDAYRVPLTNCKDIETGRIGKCCRDPYYTDPWPVNQLGKWVPDVFGGNDGKYVPDSRGSPNNPRPFITARPPTQQVTGSVFLNNFRTTQEPGLTPGYPSITPGTVIQKTQFNQGSYSQGGRGQYEQRGQGQYGQGTSVTQTTSASGQVGVGQTVNQGAYAQASKGQFEVAGQGIQRNQGSGFTVTQGVGQGVRQGVGQTITQTTGTGVTQGFGTGIRQGQGAIVTGGQGFGVQQGTGQTISQTGGIGVTQGFGTEIRQGQGIGVQRGQGVGINQGSGISISQGTGFGVTTGQGVGIRQGQGQYVNQGGFGVTQGQGLGILQGQGQALKEGQGEEITQESVHRVFLTKYDGSGQCGVPNPQKPYGNRQDLEVDFAEIPWQAMVLLQTNRSLLCGGVITRPDVVLTSASCVEGLLAKNVLIKGGEWKLGVDDEPLPYQIVQVKHILRHPLYEPGSLKYDAAVLVLSENLRLQKNIWPICLPSSSDRLDAYYNGAGECIVTGWGKNILQAHLQGSIMHGLNVSVINPQECESKLQEDYPHLLDNYDQDSCVCGQPTNPTNNICKVDTGSALACTTDGKYTLRGIYSWESGCQVGNQLAAFYKFDVEWYEWSIGLIESVRFAQFTTTQITKTKIITQVKGGIKGGTVSGIKGFGVKGQTGGVVTKGFGTQIKGFGVQGQTGSTEFGLDNASGIKTQTGQFSQFNKFTSGSNTKINSESAENLGLNFGTDLKAPLSKTFSATFTEKKIFQTEPKFVTYTTKPEIVTFTTKPEYFTYTTKPKIVTYTTKPEIVTYTTKPEIVTFTTKPEYFTFTTKPKIIAYETSGSVTNPRYVSPFSFSEIVGAKHTHSPQCNCKGKK